MGDYKGNNLIEKLGAFVPGYAGYAQREGRRKSDKLLRTTAAKEIQKKKKALDDVGERLLREGKLALIPDIDAIRRQIDLIANRLSSANCGASGFFDIIQVDERDLDRLYSYDLSIVDAIQDCLQKLDAMASDNDPTSQAGSIRQRLKQLESMIDARNKVLTEV